MRYVHLPPNTACWARIRLFMYTVANHKKTKLVDAALQVRLNMSNLWSVWTFRWRRAVHQTSLFFGHDILVWTCDTCTRFWYNSYRSSKLNLQMWRTSVCNDASVVCQCALSIPPKPCIHVCNRCVSLWTKGMDVWLFSILHYFNVSEHVLIRACKQPKPTSLTFPYSV